jgi:hypothetical protein
MWRDFIWSDGGWVRPAFIGALAGPAGVIVWDAYGPLAGLAVAIAIGGLLGGLIRLARKRTTPPRGYHEP